MRLYLKLVDPQHAAIPPTVSCLQPETISLSALAGKGCEKSGPTTDEALLRVHASQVMEHSEMFRAFGGNYTCLELHENRIGMHEGTWVQRFLHQMVTLSFADSGCLGAVRKIVLLELGGIYMGLCFYQSAIAGGTTLP